MKCQGNKTRSGRSGVGTMDMILIFIAVALVVFTAIMICLYIETGMIPDTLCTCVFSILGGECGAMAWIKTSKDRIRERGYEIEDAERMERYFDGAQDGDSGVAQGVERGGEKSVREDQEFAESEETEGKYYG